MNKSFHTISKTSKSYLELEDNYMTASPGESTLWRTFQHVTQWKTSVEYISLRDRVLKHMIDYNDYLIQAKKKFFNKYYTQHILDANYHLKDFNLIKTLGKGTFGRVMIAQRFSTDDDFCAIKLLEKSHIIEFKQVRHVFNEIKILSAVEFPFITQLLFSFISKVYICLGMPFHNGGDMFRHLRTLGKYEENVAQFYGGQVLLAFEYLHFMGIVYRDLKPENILFEPTGYIKLVDFGFAKRIEDNRTYTLCGTPDYLAPEILANKGYGKAVDWWAFGIFLFELNAGMAPFAARKPLQTYEKIMRGSFEFPSFFSISLKDLLKNIITPDLTKRFGVMRNGVNDIKGHAWFQNLNWDDLLNQAIKPTYTPLTTGPGDVQHFKEHHSESPLRSAEWIEYSEEFKDFG